MSRTALRATARSPFLYAYALLGAALLGLSLYAYGATFTNGVNVGIWGLGLMVVARDTYRTRARADEWAALDRHRRERVEKILADTHRP